MSKKSKSRSDSIVPGSRQARRLSSNPRIFKQTMKGLLEYAESCAKDRPQHVGQFFGTWEGTAHNLDSAAEQMLQQPDLHFRPEDLVSLIDPYKPLLIIFFKPLMNHLTLEENERFLAASDTLNHAWQKFFSTVRLRHPQTDKLIAELENARQQTHDAVVPLFTGEARAILTPDWAKGLTALTDGIYELTEVMA